MKKTDIKIGEKYAAPPQDYGRQGQAAGDARLVRVEVLGFGEARRGTAAKVQVRYLDALKDWGADRPAGRIGELGTRNIVCLWSEHVPAAKEREEREIRSNELRRAHNDSVTAAAQEIRALLPADLVPAGLRLAEYPRAMPSAIHLSTLDLLKIIKHI